MAGQNVEKFRCRLLDAAGVVTLSEKSSPRITIPQREIFGDFGTIATDLSPSSLPLITLYINSRAGVFGLVSEVDRQEHSRLFSLYQSNHLTEELASPASTYCLPLFPLTLPSVFLSRNELLGQNASQTLIRLDFPKCLKPDH